MIDTLALWLASERTTPGRIETYSAAIYDLLGARAGNYLVAQARDRARQMIGERKEATPIRDRRKRRQG